MQGAQVQTEQREIGNWFRLRWEEVRALSSLNLQDFPTGGANWHIWSNTDTVKQWIVLMDILIWESQMWSFFSYLHCSRIV